MAALTVQPLGGAGFTPLTCPSFTSLKQYLNPDCWVYVPSPLTVWAWTAPPPAGAGAPADPEEEEEERVRRVGMNPDTWNEDEETTNYQTKTSLLVVYTRRRKHCAVLTGHMTGAL